MPIGDAVDRAVDECIEQGILREFLLQNKAEVKHVNIYEYNEGASRRALSEYAYEEGEKSGRVNDIILLLEDIAPVSSELRKEIMAQIDEDTLKKWLRAAAPGQGILTEQFCKHLRFPLHK